MEAESHTGKERGGVEGEGRRMTHLAKPPLAQLPDVLQLVAGKVLVWLS